MDSLRARGNFVKTRKKKTKNFNLIPPFQKCWIIWFAFFSSSARALALLAGYSTWGRTLAGCRRFFVFSSSFSRKRMYREAARAGNLHSCAPSIGCAHPLSLFLGISWKHNASNGGAHIHSSHPRRASSQSFSSPFTTRAIHTLIFTQ